MRRTMESVAAERLSKIGQNPAIVSTRADLKADLSLVKEIVSSVVESEGEESDDDSKGTDDGRKEKEERAMNRIRRVIHLAKSRKKHLTNEDAEEAAEAIKRHDISNAPGFLPVPKPDSGRKRSHNRVFGLTSGVSKLFKRGGVFGEHTDNESEAYLSWNRARQQRYTKFRASFQPTMETTLLNVHGKKHSLINVPSGSDDTQSLKGTEVESSVPLITDPNPDSSGMSRSELRKETPCRRSSSSEVTPSKNPDDMKLE
ncbi:unnamed protein product [Rodentolepis nana]|uniref:MFAP1 domain-containing protein n=1 Tax=Rodentolepis nana TaxID=102285 RepID=A0A0R3TCA7_RODNA|nr:unnamed protein product [Rodentolepis nana]